MPENPDLSRSFVKENSEQEADEDGEILSKVVEDPTEFLSVKEPGSLQMEDLDPQKELFIFMIPNKTINPLSLVDTKVVVGGRKEHDLYIKNQQCKMVSYKSFLGADTPTIFLPDEMGELHQVNSQIKGHVIIKEEPQISPNHSKIDIDTLRSVHHKPPVDIKERNFLNNAGTKRSGASSSKKRSVVKELDEASPEISKKKKKKYTSSKYENSDQAENVHALSFDDSLVIKKTKKKIKKEYVENESLGLSVSMYEPKLDPPKKKKSIKLEVTF